MTHRRAARGRLPFVVGCCLALAALSLLRPWAPTTDPWGWIVWGREVLHLDLDTTVGSPAWKPLPVLITTPLAAFGSAAPALWMVVSRAAGLVAAWLAYRAAARAAGRVAGVVAVVLLVLIVGWLRGFEHGYTEPLLVALALGALELHVAGRPLPALALGTLVALGRPEALPFALVYAVVLWRAGVRPRAALVALPAVVPVGWMGGDWWGAGDPLHAHHVAVGAAHSLGQGDMLTACATLVGPLAVPAAVVGLWLRRRSPVVRALGAAVAAWTALLCVLVATGYPASPRFMLLPAAALAVLAGVGVAEALRMARATGGRVAFRGAAAAVVLAAAAAVVPRVAGVPSVVRDAEAQARDQIALRQLVRADAKSPDCGHPMLPRPSDWNAGAVAWDLGVPLERVDSALTGAHALSARDLPIDLILRGRSGEHWLGLLAPRRQGTELYVSSRWRPRLPGEQGLHVKVDGSNRRWQEIEVCPGGPEAAQRHGRVVEQ